MSESLRAAGQSGWQELSGVAETAAERIRCASQSGLAGSLACCFLFGLRYTLQQCTAVH